MSRSASACEACEAAIELKSVTKVFEQWQRDNTGRGMLRNLFKPEKKTIRALDAVSFTVRRGEFAAYAGPNGAGKSTTIKLLCGMLRPGEGDIRVLSLSPERERIQLMGKTGVLFGNRSELWGDHPVIQSFEWKKVVWGIPDGVYREALAMVTELLDLGGLLKTFARELSLGQRMRADLGMLLLHAPELILLDEPTLGLDVVAKRRMIDFLKWLNRERGVTILVTSHDMDDLEEMAQRILMVTDGRIVYDGAFDGLRALAGSLSRVRICTDGSVPALSAAFRPLEPAGGADARGVHDYAVDLGRTTVQEILAEVAGLPAVRDVEIRKAPIEEVVAGLYRKWKAG